VTFEFGIADTTPAYRVTKRMIDIGGAVIGLVLMALPMLIVAVAILVSGEPVLFRQTRVGEHGRPFTMYKFRTMSARADPYSTKPQLSAPQVTRVGRILRSSGLDEVPQLWNVLRGQMSLVGPRPEMPFIVRTYGALERLRLAARPGITGLWQVSTVRLEPIHEGLEYDLFYMAHQRIALDLWILYRTPMVLLFGKCIRLDGYLIGRWGRSATGSARSTLVLDVSGSETRMVSAIAVRSEGTVTG
jgi:lipopolysaccharide/colanic/teichoic acid biosynthesis glycosyltransferase